MPAQHGELLWIEVDLLRSDRSPARPRTRDGAARTAAKPSTRSVVERGIADSSWTRLRSDRTYRGRWPGPVSLMELAAPTSAPGSSRSKT